MATAASPAENTTTVSGHPGYFGGSTVRDGKVRRLPALTFKDLVEQSVNVPAHIPLTRKEFLAHPDKNKIKDGPWISPCSYDYEVEGKRGNAFAKWTVLLIFDFDEGKFVGDFDRNPDTLHMHLHPFNFACWRSASYTPQNPRLKLIVEVVAFSPEMLARYIYLLSKCLGLPSEFKGMVETNTISQPHYRPVKFKDEDFDAVIASRTDGRAVREDDLLDPAEELDDMLGERRYGTKKPPAENLGLDSRPVAGVPLEYLRDALSAIDPDCDRSTWIRIGMALRHQFPGEKEAREAFEVYDEWSSGGTKYQGRDDVYRTWRSFRPSAEGRKMVTVRTILKLAQNAGWTGRQAALRSDGVETTDPQDLIALMPDLSAEDRPKTADRPKTPLRIVRGVMGFPTAAPAESILLGNEWLRRGDSANMVSSAGAGKSVGSAQGSFAWALDLPYFGIRPARPLRIIHFAGEDDEVTLGQCREGFLEHSKAITGRQLTLDDLAPLTKNLRTVFNREFVALRFHALLRKLLTEEPADLVIINPLMAYIGGEVVSTAPDWLRTGLLPILQEFDCGAIIAHHTTKLSKDGWQDIDDTYSAIGGSEVANIPRAILTLRPTKAKGLWVLKASKRKTTGWRDAEGDYTDTFFVRQTANPQRPAWLPVSHAEAERMIAEEKSAPANSKKVPPGRVAEVIANALGNPVLQSELIDIIRREFSCGDRTARDAIKAAEEYESIVALPVPNPKGGKALKSLMAI